MPDPITIFRGSSGLNVKIDPARLTFDPGTGIDDLAVAVNVDHDRTGRVGRRKGFAATAITTACHSLWCDGGEALYVAGSTLCRLSPSYTSQTLASVTSGARMSYFQLDTRAFWMNGYEKGYIEAGVNNAWVKGAYVGPDTTRQLSDPPVGHLIAYEHGRAWVAQGAVVWYSPAYTLNAFDLARDFLPFESRLTMLGPVKGGVFFSTDQSIYFGAGADPRAMELLQVANYPAIEGTMAKFDMKKFGDGSQGGVGLIWTSTEGVCIGTPGGEFINLTSKNLVYPKALRGAGICFDGRYVSTLEP